MARRHRLADSRGRGVRIGCPSRRSTAPLADARDRVMRRNLLVLPACLLVLGVVATAARAEDSPAASRCELKGVPALQPAAPPGPFASVRNHVLGWVFPREQPDAALARQGGLRLVLRADTDAFRAELLDDLRDEVRCLMREARIAHGNLAVRDGSIELQLRENFDPPRALAALALAVPAGQPPGALDMRDTGNGLIQLTPTAAAYDGWLRDALERTAETIERRMQELGI